MNRILNHAHQIQVSMYNDVCNIPVNKYFTALGVCNFIGRNSAGYVYPKILEALRQMESSSGNHRES